MLIVLHCKFYWLYAQLHNYKTYKNFSQQNVNQREHREKKLNSNEKFDWECEYKYMYQIRSGNIIWKPPIAAHNCTNEHNYINEWRIIY